MLPVGTYVSSGSWFEVNLVFFCECRSTFEHEKGKNTEKVAKMELMEKDLVEMAREVERLRTEVLDAEKRANGISFFCLFLSLDLSLIYFSPGAVHLGSSAYSFCLIW